MSSRKMFLVACLLITGFASTLHSAPASSSWQESDRDRARDAWQRPAEVFEALAVKPGHRVADIGCGYGYFSFRLAARVGR